MAQFNLWRSRCHHRHHQTQRTEPGCSGSGERFEAGEPGVEAWAQCSELCQAGVFDGQGTVEGFAVAGDVVEQPFGGRGAFAIVDVLGGCARQLGLEVLEPL